MTVLPVYNILLVPHSRLYLRTGLYKSISGREPEIGEEVTLLVAKEPSARCGRRSGDARGNRGPGTGGGRFRSCFAHRLHLKVEVYAVVFLHLNTCP